jgi:hypothetical protein
VTSLAYVCVVYLGFYRRSERYAIDGSVQVSVGAGVALVITASALSFLSFVLCCILASLKDDYSQVGEEIQMISTDKGAYDTHQPSTGVPGGDTSLIYHPKRPSGRLRASRTALSMYVSAFCNFKLMN